MPRFSVLLPTHQRAEVVGAAIGSVLDQTERDFELLVVGDGCTDATAEVVAGFADPRVRWFDFPKAPGFGYANRNRALREARGELIAFMAHDDLMLPDHLELMAGQFRPSERHWAYSRPLWIDEAGRVFPFFVNLQSWAPRQDFLKVRNVLPASAVVHRRASFDLAGMWPEEIESAGDWELWKRIIAATGATRLGFCRRPTTLHFRANWRTQANWGPPPLAYMTGMAVARGSWPDPLTLAPDPADLRPLQHQVFARLRSDPAVVARLRAGVEQLADDMAWGVGLDRLYHGR